MIVSVCSLVVRKFTLHHLLPGAPFPFVPLQPLPFALLLVHLLGRIVDTTYACEQESGETYGCWCLTIQSNKWYFFK